MQQRGPRAVASPFFPALLFFLACALTLFVLAVVAPPARGQTVGGTISGHLLNASAGGQPVANARVDLSVIEGGNKRSAGTATTDSDGAFRFSGLDMAPDLDYIASAAFGGFTYSAAPVVFADGAAQQADLNVYSATESASSISIERMSVVLAAADPKQGLLTLVESYHVLNAGTDAYVGAPAAGERESLRFVLPAGARSLVALDGFTLDDATATPGGFALTTPVVPGRSTVSFTYGVPYDGRSSELRRTVSYPTAVSELVLPGGIQVSSPQLTTRSSVQLGNRSFDTLQGQSLAAGTPLVIGVAGLPSSQQGGGIAWNSLPIQMAVLALIITAIAAGTVAVRRRGRPAPLETLRRERVQLLRTVATLDERAERGQIEEERYRTRRATAMRRLETLTRQIREYEASGETEAALSDATPGRGA